MVILPESGAVECRSLLVRLLLLPDRVSALLAYWRLYCPHAAQIFFVLDSNSVCCKVSSLSDMRKQNVLCSLSLDANAAMDNENGCKSRGIVSLFPSSGCVLQAPAEGQDRSGERRIFLRGLCWEVDDCCVWMMLTSSGISSWLVEGHILPWKTCPSNPVKLM